MPIDLHIASATGEVYAIVHVPEQKPTWINFYVDPAHLWETAPAVGAQVVDADESAPAATEILQDWLGKVENRQRVAELFRQVVLERSAEGSPKAAERPPRPPDSSRTRR
jgi:hypothetical protein